MARYINIARDDTGSVLPNATINVYAFGTTTAATIYTDRELAASVLTGTTTADSKGLYSFYASANEYSIKVTSQSGEYTKTFEARIGLSDESWALRSTDADKDLKLVDISSELAVVTLKDSAADNSLDIGANKNIGINSASYGSGQGVVNIKHAGVDPSTGPSGGGGLFSDATDGQLKWIDSSGTITGASTVEVFQGWGYHPDKVPESGLDAAASDEFTGGASLSWDNTDRGTGGSCTYTYEWDTFKVDNAGVASGESLGVSAIAAPSSSSDYTFVVKLSPTVLEAAGNTIAGIFTMEGTLATPTEVNWNGLNLNKPDIDWWAGSSSSWGIFGAGTYLNNDVYTVDNASPAGGMNIPIPPMYFMVTWDFSELKSRFGFSWDGMSWFRSSAIGTAVPDFIGMFSWKRNHTAGKHEIVFHFFRTFGLDTLKIGNG